MCDANSGGKMTGVKEIVLVNHVRLHLKIMTMSDVANTAGDELDMNICYDKGGKWSSECALPFVRQEKLGTKT